MVFNLCSHVDGRTETDRRGGRWLDVVLRQTLLTDTTALCVVNNSIELFECLIIINLYGHKNNSTLTQNNMMAHNIY